LEIKRDIGQKSRFFPFRSTYGNKTTTLGKRLRILLRRFYRAMRCISAVFAVMQCPFVRLSVRLSRSWITSKRVNIVEIFSQSGSDTILVFRTRGGAAIPTGASNARGYDKMIFSQISCSMSETVIVRWAHEARQFVSIEFFFHPYNT